MVPYATSSAGWGRSEPSAENSTGVLMTGSSGMLGLGTPAALSATKSEVVVVWLFAAFRASSLM